MTTSVHSNHYKFQKQLGAINLATDTLKIILMNTTFTFDPDAHATLADVTADQLATENGYTQNDETLVVDSHTEDDTADKAVIIYDDVIFSASGGDIGPSGAAIIYDDTTADDTVIGCIDYEEDFTVTDGTSFQINAVTLNDA